MLDMHISRLMVLILFCYAHYAHVRGLHDIVAPQDMQIILNASISTVYCIYILVCLIELDNTIS